MDRKINQIFSFLVEITKVNVESGWYRSSTIYLIIFTSLIGFLFIIYLKWKVQGNPADNQHRNLEQNQNQSDVGVGDSNRINTVAEGELVANQGLTRDQPIVNSTAMDRRDAVNSQISLNNNTANSRGTIVSRTTLPQTTESVVSRLSRGSAIGQIRSNASHDIGPRHLFHSE
ncbi:uncharacterized protein LOC119689303 [Teleopsis dalmanni]|uniref:uncharacterized protein LOC119689303 n=1 Tax=Teleopsis dalmanni TaxID=139649 RepID=UPI0018CDE0ED|nr:uncharacterized protein LOC119689303 [Teleopsis dalmanni]